MARAAVNPQLPRRDAMIDHLMRLPYIAYWLPIAVAVVAAAPLLFWLLRSQRAMVAAPAGAPSADAAPPDPAVTGASSEQRSSFRRGGNTISIHFMRPGQKDNPLHASLIDRSMGGLCLLTTEAVSVGTVLSLRPAKADQIVPWIDVEVCVCRPGDETFEVGCRYVKTPPYSLLLLFG